MTPLQVVFVIAWPAGWIGYAVGRTIRRPLRRVEFLGLFLVGGTLIYLTLGLPAVSYVGR